MSTLAEPRALLSNLIRTVIVPKLCAAVEAAQASPNAPAAAHASAQFVGLLQAADADVAFHVASAALRSRGSLGALAATLLEPAARRLGDLWQADDCSEFDMSLGLVRLQLILHRLAARTPRRTLSAEAPSVLVVTPPGESHQLGAAFDAELLWHAGWTPRLEFPKTDAALDRSIGRHWIDVLDVSLSPSLRREHRLSRVADTIARARRASLNPRLAVVVNGRVFDDSPRAGATGVAQLGADAVFASATAAEPTIRQVWLRTADPMRSV